MSPVLPVLNSDAGNQYGLHRTTCVPVYGVSVERREGPRQDSPISVSRMKKLSDTQKSVLQHVKDGDPWRGCNSMSDHGGRTSTLHSLAKRGLITIISIGGATGWSITADGSRLLGAWVK